MIEFRLFFFLRFEGRSDGLPFFVTKPFDMWLTVVIQFRDQDKHSMSKLELAIKTITRYIKGVRKIYVFADGYAPPKWSEYIVNHKAVQTVFVATEDVFLHPRIYSQNIIMQNAIGFIRRNDNTDYVLWTYDDIFFLKEQEPDIYEFPDTGKAMAPEQHYMEYGSYHEKQVIRTLQYLRAMELEKPKNYENHAPLLFRQEDMWEIINEVPVTMDRMMLKTTFCNLMYANAKTPQPKYKGTFVRGYGAIGVDYPMDYENGVDGVVAKARLEGSDFINSSVGFDKQVIDAVSKIIE